MTNQARPEQALGGLAAAGSGGARAHAKLGRRRSALWAFRLGAGRDSERRVQPGQTDAVGLSRRTRSKRL